MRINYRKMTDYKKKLICILLSFCLLLVSCGSKEESSAAKSSESSTATEESSAESTSTTESSASVTSDGKAVQLYPDAPKKELKEDYVQDMDRINRSLLSTGNKERLQNVLAKAASGEEVNFAFIGGSITYGYKVTKKQCFATLLTEKLSEAFGTKVNCINAGISGTPSVLGNLRVERDVLAYEPDFVLIEFAVNDGFEDAYKNSYESLINKILSYKTAPAVMLLFTITRTGHSCEEWMSKIGEHYELPMVSVVQSVWKDVQDGKISYDDYSGDETHPNAQGHIWITEFLYHCIKQVYDSDFETKHYEIPEKASYKKYFKDMTLYASKDLPVSDLGSWAAKRTMESFPDGWAYKPGDDNKPFVFKAD